MSWKSCAVKSFKFRTQFCSAENLTEARGVRQEWIRGHMLTTETRETANAYWKRYITLAALESHPGRRNSEEEYLSLSGHWVYGPDQLPWAPLITEQFGLTATPLPLDRISSPRDPDGPHLAKVVRVLGRSVAVSLEEAVLWLCRELLCSCHHSRDGFARNESEPAKQRRRTALLSIKSLQGFKSRLEDTDLDSLGELSRRGIRVASAGGSDKIEIEWSGTCIDKLLPVAKVMTTSGLSPDVF